ncbi:neuroligin-4, X-linked-like isoform X1 [Centruroides sculpturatus]|uniref:neuroligin-4, X-linked-like isoform X1 n=1 Tax=Centruroides sculpturatus TaxID=218467 RepID=UPI000C6EA0C1|nr:neuroligin-4, X-linked-like isoform X1 [Centruroides sculpturatus]
MATLNFLMIFLTVAITTWQWVASDPRRLASRVVPTKYGDLRGYTISLPHKSLQPIDVFLGVPYASAPVGSLRFMPPVTPPHWKGVRTADRFSPVCPQRYPDVSNETEALKRMPAGRLEYLKRLIPYLRNQSEDCLYLNIYAPSGGNRDNAKFPVMMYIHGESYEWNSGNPYDGSVLASFGNAVVITINYRLGVLGFLPVKDGTTRGNYGLMDQIAALHWIQENVAEFGGDPHNVTVFGHGHGAACVNLLMLSPMSKDGNRKAGLFHRAILQSGSALSPWSIAHDAHTYTRHLARILGCPTEESLPLVECMRQRPVTDIMRVQLMVPEHLTAFGPTIDGIMVVDDPATAIEDYGELYGHYDLLFGVTRIESYFHFSAHEDKFGIELDRRDRLLRTLVRNLFTYHLQEIFLTIVNEYTDWTRPEQHPINVLDGTVDALGDALITAPLFRTGNYHSTVHAKTFAYVFSYQTEIGDYNQRLGCIHGEDLSYVFGAPLLGSLFHFSHNYSKAEVALSEAVMTYWVNFARYGDPNILPTEPDSSPEKTRGRFDRLVWPPYEKIHQRYLMIAMKPKVKDHYHAHRLSFWLHLIPKLHRAGDSSVAPQHHLLEDHDNPRTYDGVVRQLSLTIPSMSTIVPINTPLPETSSTVQISRYTEPTWTTERATTFPTGYNTLSSVTTASVSTIVQHNTYSTALSVTIAVGCSLLILNVLIFAGVYYQRDKNRVDTKLHHRDSKGRRHPEGEPSPVTATIKQFPLKAPPPSPACQPQTLEFPPPPPNMFVPKVPLKPNTIQPKDHAEGHVLFSAGGAKPYGRQTNTQEMRV